MPVKANSPAIMTHYLYSLLFCFNANLCHVSNKSYLPDLILSEANEPDG